MNVLERNGIHQVRGWLTEECGIFYPDEKSDLLRQRMDRVVHSFGMANIAQLAVALAGPNNREIALAVMHEASTNHTYFFREADTLDFFVKNILKKNRGNGPFRIWSAACSTGEEAYTIAMLAAEAGGPALLSRLSILATDISAPVIAHAERGTYSDRQVSHVPPRLVEKYFTRAAAGGHQISEQLRNICEFHRLNLKGSTYPPQDSMQVIFCRNIFYYLTPADQVRVLTALHACTEPGGWLITSVTEPLRDLGTPWVPVTTGVYRRAQR